MKARENRWKKRRAYTIAQTKGRGIIYRTFTKQHNHEASYERVLKISFELIVTMNVSFHIFSKDAQVGKAAELHSMFCGISSAGVRLCLATSHTRFCVKSWLSGCVLPGRPHFTKQGLAPFRWQCWDQMSLHFVCAWRHHHLSSTNHEAQIDRLFKNKNHCRLGACEHMGTVKPSWKIKQS